MNLLAMFVLACEVIVGNVRFRSINEAVVTASWRSLSDTAVIKIPRLDQRLQDNFNEGDAVRIDLAYDGVYRGTEFEGYVSKINPIIPFEIHCEDEIYWLKKINLKQSWKNVTLNSVVQFIVDEANKVTLNGPITLSPDIPDVTFTKFRLNNVNGAQALQKIKDEFGLTAYFRGKVLYVGLAFIEQPGTVKYSLDWNVINSQTKLTFRKSEDVRLKVKAIGIKKDNSKIEVEVGDADGELRTLFFYNIDDTTKLKTLANEEIQKLKFEGYEGTLKTFLVPSVIHGMTADIIDPVYPERAGKYVVDTVTTRFGQRGAKRDVEIGIKVS